MDGRVESGSGSDPRREVWLAEPLSSVPDAIETLQSAHVQIDHVLALAGALTATSATRSTAAAAQAVCDFIAGGLKEHLDDEAGLAPVLAGRHPVVDKALATMGREQFRLEATLARLNGLCRLIARDPRRLFDVRFDLDQVVGELTTQLEQHHGLEESIIFPALKRLLDPATLTQLRLEMSRRRRTLV